MKNIICLLLFITASFVGCSGTAKGDSKRSEQDKVSIVRFDRDLYNYLEQPDSLKEVDLVKKYPLLLPAFGRIAMDNSDPATFFSSMREYFSHPALIKIYKDELASYKDLSLYEEELATVNSLISEHIPGKKLPQLCMHISGFRENVIILNNLISISAEKYLGNDYPAYKEFFQPYERQQMQPKYIVRDYVKAWLMSDLLKTNTNEQNLLSAMITEGKILYALSILLPQENIEDLIGYTSTQSTWCKDNEKSIWLTIIKKNYLYSTDNMIVTRFINDAPYTATISQESPGRLGSWIGWQIVNQYAKKKGFSLEDILKADAQSILKESKYSA